MSETKIITLRIRFTKACLFYFKQSNNQSLSVGTEFKKFFYAQILYFLRFNKIIFHNRNNDFSNKFEYL